MSSRPLFAAALLLAPALALYPTPAAEAAPPSIYRRAVDRLTIELPDGGTATVTGVFAGRVEAAAGGEVVPDPAGAVRFAVRRDAVEADHPGLIERFEFQPTAAEPEGEKEEVPESDDPVKIAAQLRDRLVPWLERRADEQTLAARLEREFERVSDLLADAEEGVEPPDPRDEPEPPAERERSVRKPRGPWAVLAVPREAIVDRHSTAAHRRRLALHAWDVGLRRVADRSADDLRDELDRKGVDRRSPVAVPWETAAAPAAEPEGPFVAKLQDDREWAARVAVVESDTLPDLSFQGTGSTLIRTPKSGEAVNGQALMAQLAGGQYADLISELSEPNAFSRRTENRRRQQRNKTATDAADRAGRVGVRVTRVTPDMTTGRVTVESEFLAKLPNDEWAVIWSAAETRDASDADPAVQERLKNDPQLKGILNGGGAGGLGGLGGLLGGLGGGSGGLMETALQTGAATKVALDAVNAEFEEWRLKFTDRLDGPPLAVPAKRGGSGFGR